MSDTSQDFSTDDKEKSDDQKQREELAALGLPPNVQIQNADEQFQLQQPDPNAKGPWIQYDGVAGVRTLTPEDWKAAGVEGEYAEWNYLNKKRLPRSQFSDEQLQYLLRRDGRFSLVQDDDKEKKEN